MKFLCLIAADRFVDQMSADEAARHYQEYRELIDDLRQNGHYVGGQRLLPPTTAKSLRVRDGKAIVTDGPFAETKEQVGGFILLEAANLEQALQLASRIPGAKFGVVEVRPLAEDPQTRDAMRN